MCGQARPSQRPCPPRRQPSLPPDDDIEDYVLPSTSRGGDRAPRSVQRHRSGRINSIDISGTLIMTDDPADYETQDGKKPGEDDEVDEQEYAYEQRSREDDPTLDESVNRHRRRETDHEPYHHNEGYPPAPRRSSYDHDRYEAPSSAAHACASAAVERRHTYQGQLGYQQQPSPPARKPYTDNHNHGGSGHTLPTAYMGDSGASSRLRLEDNSFADDVSSLSSGGCGGGRSSRHYHHQHHHQQGGMNNSSRRHLTGARPRLAAPQEVHYHGQSNGLPVISREQSPRYSYGTASAHPQHRQCSSSRLMGDYSANSHISMDNSSRRSLRQSLGSSAAGSASVRQMIPEDAAANIRSLARGASMASLPASSGAASGYLPSLAPPPVPTMDSPGDVNCMAVFAKDHQAAERASNRRKSANEARKDRSNMLDNLSRSGAIPNISASQHSLGNGSNVSLASSSRRLQPTSTRGLSTRLLGSRQEEVEDDSIMDQSQLSHPAMLQDTEALDSPNTRRERRKERRRMKGAVRTLMATMRMSSATKTN